MFWSARNKFENDVEMYGAQAMIKWTIRTMVFENDVEMYGAQAILHSVLLHYCLRMM